MQAMNSLLSQQKQSRMSLQDLQNNGEGNNGASSGHQQHMAAHSFDPTSSNDDFLEQILSSVPSSSPWPDLSKPWENNHHQHHQLTAAAQNPTGASLGSPGSGDGQSHHQFNFDDQSSLLESKLRQHQITGGAAAVAKAMLLQQQLLMSGGLAGGDQNDDVANPANDISVQALYNGFTGSLGQTSQHFHQSQGGSMQAQCFGAPASSTMNQTPAASGSCGGGAAPAQPKQQRVRARRGQATDPHSIAERQRRERIAERMKGLQELVPNANKTDKASMLDEIIDYVKFLQLQVKVLSMSRLGGAAAVAPRVAADMSSEGGGDCVQGNGGRSSNGTASTSNNDSMTVTEHQVAKLMEEDMGSAMQYLQGKGLCLMPISLATALSTATCQSRNPLNRHNNGGAGSSGNAGGGGGPSSPSMSALTVQSTTTIGTNGGAEE